MDVKIGIAGLGVIGTGVVHLLQNNGELINERSGVNLIVHAVADLDFKRERDISLEGIKQYDDAMALAADPDIDLLVELVGGVDFPKKIVTTALENGKHVVTANKALMAKAGEDIYALAAEKKAALGIEASVAGGIPIIKAIRESLSGNRVQEIRGIINGTSNYILTKMTEDNLSFKEALVQAQELGFAEADPTLDISGGDAAHKIAILAALAFNTPVDMDAVYMEGVDGIDSNDIKFARELGYVVKLIAIARDRGEEGIEARVHPTLVPLADQLAGIRNEFNAVFVRCDYLGDGMLTGKGAGAFPTASAVVGDLVDIAIKLRDNKAIAPYFTSIGKRDMVPFGRTQNRYYLHFSTMDYPGILSRISGILGEHEISIASVIQKESVDGESVPLVMVTHQAIEDNVVAAIKAIDKMSEIKKPTVFMRAL